MTQDDKQPDPERAAIEAANAISPDDLAAFERGEVPASIAQLQAALLALRGEAEAPPPARLSVVEWLGQVRWLHGRREPVGQVAERLAALAPEGEALPLRDLARSLRLPLREVVAALDTLEAEGFISNSPSIKAGFAEIALFR